MKARFGITSLESNTRVFKSYNPGQNKLTHPLQERNLSGTFIFTYNDLFTQKSLASPHLEYDHIEMNCDFFWYKQKLQGDLRGMEVQEGSLTYW